jgi:predicted transcriptional regulator of viral defense system
LSGERKRAIKVFKKHGAQLRMSEAIRLGISRYMLYSLRDEGIIETVSRGVYRLTEAPMMSQPDLVAIAVRFSGAVVCLISALSFHEITTQVPHEIDIAILRGTHIPCISYPPTNSYQFSKKAFEEGVEEHVIDGVKVKVYCPEKTIADCFKFRNKIGMDIVLEAMKLYKIRKKFNVQKLLKFAKVCRVEKIMMPYLEAII